jgi:murein DD-endopeptidase MepM/ murein hydrolase activator NlpD
MHPVPFPISTPYRKPGPMWSLGFHTGVDYACPVGTDVVAPAPGYVARVAWDKSYGNYILIRTPIGGVTYNVYLCHLSRALVKPGVTVKMGQHIGESGNTGNSSGPHVHLEVRQPPYGFNKNDIVNPSVVYNFQAGTVPPSTKPAVIPVCVWNIARPRWYTPWKNRAAEIQREIRNEAKVYMFQELFDAEPIATVAAALPTCERIAGRAGLEFFYEKASLKFLNSWDHYSGIANRWAQEVELEDRATGIRISFLNIHAPIKAEGATAKARYGKWLEGIEAKTKYKTVIGGDTNAPSESDPPKSNLRKIGYIGFKEQAQITNENVREFIPKKQDLCDIRTRPGRVQGGEVDVSTNTLESDHRRIEATVVIAP